MFLTEKPLEKFKIQKQKTLSKKFVEDFEKEKFQA